MKIAILYDTLIDMGGAERVAIELANELHADIITSGYNPKIGEWLPIKGNVIDIGNMFAHSIKPLGVLIEAPIRYMVNRQRIAEMNYDLYIYIGFTSIYASVQSKRNIWYCLTPNRMLYDLYQRKVTTGSLFSRIFFYLNNFIFHSLDQKIVKSNFRTIVAQTAEVRIRIQRYYQKDAEVNYAPVRTDRYVFKEVGDYYFTVARLYPEKRIALIAEAFSQMPEQKLIIAGDGPDKESIQNIIRHAPHITLMSNVPEDALIDLYARCKATIYMPVNEDYGLIPLEGMASGKMCIAANEGGLKETVLDKTTGYLIEPTIPSIMKTVRELTTETALAQKDACIAQARIYDIATIINKWDKIIGEIVIPRQSQQDGGSSKVWIPGSADGGPGMTGRKHT